MKSLQTRLIRCGFSIIWISMCPRLPATQVILTNVFLKPCCACSWQRQIEINFLSKTFSLHFAVCSIVEHSSSMLIFFSLVDIHLELLFRAIGRQVVICTNVYTYCHFLLNLFINTFYYVNHVIHTPRILANYVYSGVNAQIHLNWVSGQFQMYGRDDYYWSKQKQK
jgi:hypothetical protein